jgi:DNA-binding CsgD family transcriptional regulator
MMELQLGHSNKAIALNLGMSENTVKMHIQHLMRKLGARTRTEAVFIWARGTAGSDLPDWVPSH